MAVVESDREGLMGGAAIGVSVDGGIGTLFLDRGEKHNAISLAMWHAIPEKLAQLEADPAVRAIVLRGNGSSSFSAGADLSEFDRVRADLDGNRSYDIAIDGGVDAVITCSKPVIGLIHGFCLGGGFALAAACDLRMASTSAMFGVPAALLGIAYPPRALRVIVDAIGTAAAKNLLFTGRQITAEEARALGFVQAVVPLEELETQALSLAQGIAANAPLSIRASKLATNCAAGLNGADESVLQRSSDACHESEDYREGQAARAGKRQPSFKGR